VSNANVGTSSSGATTVTQPAPEPINAIKDTATNTKGHLSFFISASFVSPMAVWAQFFGTHVTEPVGR